MTKQYQVTFNSGDENSFKVYIGDTIVNFTDKYDRLYLSKSENIFRKVAEERKINMIKGLNNLQIVW